MLITQKKRAAAFFLSLCLLAGPAFPSRAAAADIAPAPDSSVSENELPPAEEAGTPELPEISTPLEEPDKEENAPDDTEDGDSVTAFETAEQPRAAVVNEVESNNTLDTANTIEVNTQVSGSLSTSSDKDWFAFTIPSDGYISLTFSHDFVDSSSTYWHTTFYTSGNEELDSWNWKGNTTEPLTTNNIGVAAGTYYFCVVNYGYNLSSANYYFEVNYTQSNDWEKEFNESLAYANAISTNKKFYGGIRSSDDKDWYVFQIPSNGYISLTFDHDFVDSSSAYWDTAFYTSGNAELDSWNWKGNTTEPLTTNNIGVAAGTYYFCVADYGYNLSSADYYFKVNYTPSNDWEKEFNESLPYANAIITNKKFYGGIRSSDDKDWYVFQVPSDGYISLTFDHDFVNNSSNYWDTTFYTSGNEELDSWYWKGNTTEPITTNNIGVAAGTYYLCVADYGYNLSSADYCFEVNYTPSNDWEKEFNESLTNANTIFTNKIFYGSIRSSDDEDWYAFTIPSDGYISLTFSHGFVDSSSSYWSTAFYTSGNKSLQSWSWKGNTDAAATTDKISVTTGTYYLCVADYGYNLSSADYHFTVNYVLPDGSRPLPPLPISSKGGFAEVTAFTNGVSTMVTVDTATLSKITPAAGSPLVFAALGRNGAASGTVNTTTGEITFQTALKSGDKILFLHPGTYSPLTMPIILG